MTSKELSDMMIVYRAKHRLSQAKFAELCGVTPQTIYLLETEQQKPREVTLAKILLVVEGRS